MRRKAFKQPRDEGKGICNHRPEWASNMLRCLLCDLLLMRTIMRVAEPIANAEELFVPLTGSPNPQEWAEAFYDVMVEGKFLPNSPTLMNAGKGNGLQFSACFVLPVEDTIDGIFDSIKHAAIIHK